MNRGNLRANDDSWGMWANDDSWGMWANDDSPLRDSNCFCYHAFYKYLIPMGSGKNRYVLFCTMPIDNYVFLKL
jgi:hypothetical protein